MDIRVNWDVTHGALAMSGPDLATDDGLDTAIILSLFCDARAGVEDGLQPGDDPRGWWADTFADIPGDQTGSKLWLLYREKQTASVRHRAKAYAEDALQWLLDDGVAASVTVTAQFNAPGRLDLNVAIARPHGAGNFTRQYQYVWSSPDAL